jgi:hypothetical protein
MRRLYVHLRQHLAHHALDPGLGGHVLKAGLAKAAAGASAALVIPVAAVGTYAIPASTIKQFTAPIVGAAPEIFDSGGLAQISRERLKWTLSGAGAVVETIDQAAGDLVSSVHSEEPAQTVALAAEAPPVDLPSGESG